MGTYLNKAIGDLAPGKQDANRDFLHHYTHLLPDNLRTSGYQVKVSDGLDSLGVPQIIVQAQAPAENGDGLRAIGFIEGTYNKDAGKLSLHSASVSPKHQSKGIGMSMYEAALAHAKKIGLTHVVGGHHSTMAHRVHQKLAEKHGLSYKGEPAIGGTYRDRGEWNRAESGPHDEKYGSYQYTIKSEVDVDDLIPDLKPEVPEMNIPSRFLAKAEPNLYSKEEIAQYEGAAVAQSGAWTLLMEQLDGVRRLLGLRTNSVTLNKARALYAAEEDADAAKVALEAYNLRATPSNRAALEMVMGMEDFGKEEAPLTIASYKIAPVNAEGVSTADAIQRAADGGYINAVKLNGKHSKGTMLAKDPQTKKVYLLKPGSGKNSPARGVSEIAATQSEREAAFWHVADAWGIGDAFPRADLILVNNHQTAAMELLGITYRNLGSKKREDPNLPARILEPYRQNATLFKWSLIDYVLGNPDRHSQNMMVDPDDRQVKLIDHGSALAGKSFDPSEDDNSFIPFYLRAWTNQKFKDMQPHLRLRYMPGLNPRAEQVFDEWVARLNEDTMAEILTDYNVDPSPALERLSIIRAMPGPKWLVLNKLWAGAV